MSVCLSTLFLLVYISVSAVTAAYGFALTASPFWQTPGMPAQPKGTKRSRPKRPAPRLGSGSLRCGIPPGTSPPVCCAAPPLDVCGFAARRCAPAPRMNASTQPAEGAGGSKARSTAKAAYRSYRGWFCQTNPHLSCLAPLPTTPPESAGLCGLAVVPNVSISLPIQRSGLAIRLYIGITPLQTLIDFVSAMACHGGCAWETFGSTRDSYVPDR
jgi:hypothetical protein